MKEDLAAAVREIRDRQDILACIYRYCRGVDRLDREVLLSAYHPDGVDDHGIFVGTREEFADFFFEYHSRTQYFTSHNITNHLCHLDGDVAHAESYYIYVAQNREGTPLNMVGGRYVDRLERRDGRWGIVARKCLQDWQGAPGYREPMPGSQEARERAGPPTRDRSDPSYQRPLVIDLSRFGQTVAGYADAPGSRRP